MPDSVATASRGKGVFSRAIGIIFSPGATYREALQVPRPAGILFLCCLVIALATTMRLVLPVPGLGLVELAWGEARIPGIGTLELYWRPVGDEVLATLFRLPNWHLLWFVWPVLLGWRWQVLRGEHVDLSKLKANVFNVIAEGDHITPPCQSEGVMNQIGSQDKQVFRVRGGHIGIMAGSGAEKNTWPHIEQWLAARSD